MDSRYGAWVEAFEQQHNGFMRGLCHEAANEMKSAFPELVIKQGFAHVPAWGAKSRQQHWWLETASGEVVDPTASQFEGPVEYEFIDLSRPDLKDIVPTGRCMECGGDTYHREDFCNTGCRDSFTVSLMGETF